MFRTIAFCIGIIFLSCLHLTVVGQAFVHPGINQAPADLALMKKKVLAGEEPYAGAFERLKLIVDTPFTPQPHAHVLRGPYGKPNIGGDELARSARMAYHFAIAWYITDDRKYANKAIEILNAWSPVLWHFDYNDAKLIAGLTGHELCNAAEILRYTNSGWGKEDIEQFSNMLMTAYYPVFRFYFPNANGNWDGAIIHSILAIAVFTDNRKMFNNAVNHFLYGPVNGSLFKYIYPNGQCQETARDQGHVQLGLGEFAGAAQIAFTQGRDLLSAGNNRLALGYEFTSQVLLNETPQSYGPISQRAKGLSDCFEYVYRHYTANGISMPFTKRTADSVRPRASRSILTAIRSNYGQPKGVNIELKPETTGYIAGADRYKAGTVANNAIIVQPGDAVQAAIDKSAGTGRWVLLKKGIHKIPGSLRMPSGVTLAGEGIETILFLDPQANGMRDAIVNASNDLHDVIIRDLKIEGSNRTDIPGDPNSNRSYRGAYNRGGIVFRSSAEGQMKNIQLINLSLLNCSYNGLFISGADNIKIEGCDFTENGSGVIPGPRLQHNILLTHCNDVTVTDNRIGTSPFGSGVSLAQCSNVSIHGNEIARNANYGVQIAESKDIRVTSNLIEGNDRTGVMIEFLSRGSAKIVISNNQLQYNGGHGLEASSVSALQTTNNIFTQNKEGEALVKSAKVIIME